MRSKHLAARINGFSPRSIYRCLNKLEAHGLVERSAGSGAPPRVLLRLTEPAGRDLFRLVHALTTDSRVRCEDFSWESMRLLGELWEMGFVEELGYGARTLLELLDVAYGLSYHQVRRRTSQFLDEGLLEGCSKEGTGRRYELIDKARRCTAVIAGVGRWRHRSFLADGTPGLEIEELATVLRAALPLARLPEHGGMSIDLIVAGPEDKYGRRETATVYGTVGPDGLVGVTWEPGREPDGSATATTNTWFAALLDGNRGRIRVRGDLGLVDACLTQLYDALWDRTSR